MSKLATWLRHEPGLKAVSLVLAVVLWAWRQSEGNPLEERVFANLPLTVENLAEGLKVVGERPTVTLVLSGPRRSLDRLAGAGRLEPTVDCAEVRQPSWPSLPIEVRLPENIEIKSVTPAQWEVEIDTLENDIKPIWAEVGNTAPPEGYLYEPPELGREQATVRGPRKRVSRVAYVVADIDLSGRRVDFVGQARLRPVDSDVQVVDGVECDPRVVNVTVRISRIEETRELRVVVPIEDRVANGFVLEKYEVDPVTVTVEGTREGFKQLEGEAISTAPLDITGRQQSFTKEVPLLLPRGVASDTRRVRVTVTIQPAPDAG